LDKNHPEFEAIGEKKKEVLEAWQKLKSLSIRKQERLFGAHEIQRFNRDADETIAWMNEKDSLLSSEDCGRDLASVQTLQRKHEGVERDLAALEEKVSMMEQESHQLRDNYPEHGSQIKGKCDEILKSWAELAAKVEERKRKLQESYLLQRFLSDYRDLLSWMNDMKSEMSGDELAKDVNGAEALLERNSEHKAEIDARESFFRVTADSGRALLDSNHYATEEIKEKLITLAEEKVQLLEIWEKCRILYEQSMDLQLFHRDKDQADQWMSKQETFLDNDNLGDSLDSVEAMIKKHEDFEKSLVAQEEKVNTLNDFASKLIEGNHFAADEIANTRALLLERRSALMDKSAQRKMRLQDSFNFQQFERDCDETKGWINEKLKVATDDSYLDPSNLNSKLQKHQNFDSELGPNKTRLDEVVAIGEQLIESGHLESERIKKR
jgi:spectrin alpha